MQEIIVQAGYMTGDMFGVAAALRLDINLRVLLVHDNSDQRDAKRILQFYLSSVPTAHQQRIAIKEVANSRTFYKSLHEPKDAMHLTHVRLVKKMFKLENSRNAIITAIGRSTKIVLDQFGPKEARTREQLIQQWRIDDFDQLGLQRFANRRGISLAGKYLFLWVRLSGKMGGAHPELDSSRHGWQQIIDALPADITPVIVGDRFKTPLVNKKGSLIDLVEFWNEIPFCLYKHSNFVGAEGRRAQFALFDYLVQTGCRVCHLGMRSGVLESVALMGGGVIYMEQKNNPQRARIQELANSMGNYERLELKALPKRSGKLIDAVAQDWGKIVKPKIVALMRHCNEDFKLVAERARNVQDAVGSGASFGTYWNEYLRLSIDAWKNTYPGVTNWNRYSRDNRNWCATLKRLVQELYDASWNKKTYALGFDPTDLTKIIAAVRRRLP